MGAVASRDRTLSPREGRLPGLPPFRSHRNRRAARWLAVAPRRTPLRALVDTPASAPSISPRRIAHGGPSGATSSPSSLPRSATTVRSSCSSCCTRPTSERTSWALAGVSSAERLCDRRGVRRQEQARDHGPSQYEFRRERNHGETEGSQADHHRQRPSRSSPAPDHGVRSCAATRGSRLSRGVVRGPALRPEAGQ